MMDLRKYTVKDFAEAINEEPTTIQTLIRENIHLGYTTKPYDNVVIAVNNSTVREDNKEVVAKFLYTNLFNRPEHRYHERGRGKGMVEFR